MAADKVTGKAGAFTFNSSNLHFKKWNLKVDRKLADTTDSENYDNTSDMLYPSQLPVKLEIEGTVEGWYRKTEIPSVLLGTLFSGATAVATVFKVDAATTFGHGNFDLSSFEIDEPVDDTVTFTCNVKLNGTWTNGS